MSQLFITSVTAQELANGFAAVAADWTKNHSVEIQINTGFSGIAVTATSGSGSDLKDVAAQKNFLSSLAMEKSAVLVKIFFVLSVFLTPAIAAAQTSKQTDFPPPPVPLRSREVYRCGSIKAGSQEVAFYVIRERNMINTEGASYVELELSGPSIFQTIQLLLSDMERINKTVQYLIDNEKALINATKTFTTYSNNVSDFGITLSVDPSNTEPGRQIQIKNNPVNLPAFNELKDHLAEATKKLNEVKTP